MTMEIDALHAGQPMRNSLDPCNTCAEWLALKAENDRLRAFAREVLSVWPHGDLDGGELQDAAVASGLLVPETRAAPCGEACNCAEHYDADEWRDGITCYRRAAWLKA